jgi:cholest-4-en-3-one 26-monooxygenase
MMSALVNGEVDGEKLTDAQIGMFFVTMSIAGHETTRSTAAHFIRLMNEHPDQYALVRSDPDRYLPNAIEEVLRVSPPVIQFRRTVTRDAEIGGQAVKAGDKIYLSYPAANRDPSVFPIPTGSTSPARTPSNTSPSAPAHTSASARAWPASN